MPKIVGSLLLRAVVGKDLATTLQAGDEAFDEAFEEVLARQNLKKTRVAGK